MVKIDLKLFSEDMLTLLVRYLRQKDTYFRLCCVTWPKIALSSLACPVMLYFHIYSHKGMILKNIAYELRFLVFATNYDRNIYCKKH